MDVTEDEFLKGWVPCDGGCLFWAVSMAYLLPVKNKKSLFMQRFEKLFGKRNRDETLRVRDLIVKDLSSAYEDKQFAELVTNVFRNRVVDQMTMKMTERKVFHTVTMEDFVLMKTETFITDGTFCELFQSSFPSLTFLTDLNKLKPEQLNEKSIEVLNGELDKILNDEQIHRFKFNSYLNAMRNGCSWAGEREIQVIESMLQCQIFRFSDTNLTCNIDNNSVNICLVKANAGRYDFGLVKPEVVIEAIMKLKYELAIALVKIGVDDVWFRYNNDWTLLHFATLTNDFQSIIKHLVWQGADLNLITKNKHTPLQMAEYFELEKAIASLQSLTNKNRITIAAASKTQNSTLNQSSSHKQGRNEANSSVKPKIENVKPLEERIPFINIKLDCPTPNPSKQIFVPEEVFNQSLNFAHDLVEGRAYFNANFMKIIITYNDNSRIEIPKWSPLHYAAEIGNVEIAKALIERGINTDVDIKDDNGGTPLKRAAKYGQFKVVKYLKERGADVNAKNKLLVSALSCAARNGHDHIVHYLIENRAEINTLDKDGMTPVHHAVKVRRWNAVKCLVEHKADVNIPDNNNKTPLNGLVEKGEWDMLKYLLENGALLMGLSDKQKQNINEQLISSLDKDVQLSRAIALGNVELLERLISKNKKNLNKAMFKTYHKFKLLNVPLTHDMCVFIENKLMDDSYFLKNQLLGDETKVNGNAENIKMRIEITAKCVDALANCLMENKNEIDDVFLFNGKCIAKNLQILKRQLRCTYHILPWEEMQFYLVTFLFSYIEPNRVDAITNLAIHETRLITYLNIFKNILESVHVEDIFQKSNTIMNRNRNEIKFNIVSLTPQFKDLYEDFEHVKDMHSLNRIKTYISIACKVDLVKDPELGQLVIERALQVTGECLKNTVESPNLSENVNNSLLIYAPKNLRNIITSLRDSLSHVKHSTKIINNNNSNYFLEIQSDLKKLQPEITYINFRKKCAVVKSFLERIISSSNVEDMWVDNREMHFYDICVLENENNTCFDKITYYLTQLKHLLRKPTDFQKHCLENLEKFMNQETKNKAINDKHQDYLFDIESLIDLIKKRKSLDDIHRLARTILSSFLKVNYDEKSNNFNSIFDQIMTLRCSIEDLHDEAQLLIWEMVYIIKFDVEKIQNIEEFNQIFKSKNNISTTGSSGVLKKLENEILVCISKLAFDIDVKNQIREEFESKKDAYNLKNKLVKFFNKELSADELPDENQFRSWVQEFNFKLAKKETYSSLYYEAKSDKCVDLVQRIKQKTENSYGKLVKALEQKSTNDFSPEIHKFLKAFIAFKNANSEFQQPNSSKTEQNSFLKTFLFQNMKTLNNLLIKVKNDSDLLIFLRTIDDFRAAIEMLMLRITEILGQLQLFETNTTFLDEPIPSLIGKNLRNYLAHGDLLMDILSTDHLNSLIFHICSIQKNCSEINFVVYDGNKRIGNTNIENIQALERHYQTSLQLLSKQKTIINAIKKNNIKDSKRILNNEIDFKNKNFNGWTLLFHTAKADNLDTFTYLFKHQTSVYYRDKLGHSILYYLAKYGSIKIIKHLFEHKEINPNVTLHKGKSLLHVSAEFGQIEIANYLLANNVDANVTDNARATPIYYATMNNHANIVSSLIIAGADVHFKHHTGASLMHYAAMNGCIEIMQLLIHHNVDTNSITCFHQTPLHFSCMNGHANVTEMLLKNKATINAASGVGYTPLQYAAQHGYAQIVVYLLENAAAINLASKIGETALHVACWRGHTEVVKLLLEKGADINARTNEGNAPLHFASSTNNLDLVKLLLDDYKVDVNAANKFGVTPFHKASEVGSMEVVKLMLEHGANVNCAVNVGQTPLHMAAQGNTQQVVRLLLQHGADVNAGNRNGVTPIDSAMYCCRLDNIKLLLENNAEVVKCEKKVPLAFIAVSHCYEEGLKALINNRHIIDQQYHNDDTLLHYATFLDNRKIVEFLLKNKANVRLLNSDGHSALHVAAGLGRKNVMEIMLRIYPNIIDLKSAEGLSPLQVASIVGRRDIVEMLIDKGAEVNFICNEAYTALHYAVAKGHTNIVEYLLNNGANVNAQAVDKSAPIHLVNRPELSFPAYKLFPICQYMNGKLNRIKVAECLIKFGAEVNAIDGNKRSVLHWAAMNGLHELIRLLCKNNALLNEKDFMDRTALQWAGELGHIRCMMYLMMFGADAYSFTNKHFTEFY